MNKDMIRNISIISGIVVLSVILLIIIMVNTDTKYLTFYYPTPQSDVFTGEKRAMPPVSKDNENPAVNITREYMLGPIDYQLQFIFSDRVHITSLYCITNSGEEAIVINFNRNLISYLFHNSHNGYLVFKGLARTLKENTSIKYIFIRVENQSINMFAGKINIYYPITVNSNF